MLKPVQASSPTLRDIIEGGFVYVDKTRYLYELVRYAQKYRLAPKPITLIGANFDSTQRKVTDWKMQTLVNTQA